MIDDKNLDGFNSKQKEAILTGIDQDVLVSAAAGSGKTKTLSEKVARMIKGGEVKPDELLVLTFTNNAAHEMKTRIMNYFSDSPELQVQMLSCHIQTFDSFNQYLVSLYADRLGISSSINVVNEAFLKVKRKEILDQIIIDFCQDETSRDTLLKSVANFDTTDLSKTKDIIESIYSKIVQYSPSELLALESYLEDSNCTEENYKKIFDEYVTNIKSKMIEQIKDAYIKEQLYYLDMDGCRNLMENPSFVHLDYTKLAFGDKFLCQPLYEEYLEILKLDGEDFLKAALAFNEREIEGSDSKKYFKVAIANQKPDKIAKNSATKFYYDAETDIEGYKIALNFLKDILVGSRTDNQIFPISLNPCFKENYLHWKDYMKHLRLFLSLAKILKEKLFDYQKSHNAFYFADITNLALTLLEEDEEVSRKIRSRFKYVMIDEYQDTNPIQERFLSAITKEVDGTKNHLFAVGDPKQSIYLFRDSKVELFVDRQKQYEDPSNPGQVIHMNNNYRSGEKLLKEINEIFKKYMALDHGGVDYSRDDEQLHYDHKVDLYSKPFDGFGIYRLLPDNLASTNTNTLNIRSSDTRTWEAKAIAKDIASKVGVMDVYDRSIKGIRKARYDDFVILKAKIQSSVEAYSKAFEEAGIPLNVKKREELSDNNTFKLIKSILNVMLYFIKKEEKEKTEHVVDLRHSLASVLRSYIYSKSDDEIYQLLKWEFKDSRMQKDYSSFIDNPILDKFKDFASRHLDSTFDVIFSDLIDEFGIISNLNKVGNITQEMEKIDGLYSSILSQEKLGQGLEAFIDYLNNMNAYRINNDSESLISNENSVELMSIHASKGLEKKIVYLPVDGNNCKKGGHQDTKTLVGNEYPALCDYSPEGFDDISYLLFKEDKKGQKEKIDDHVRLFYVAFTRAENQIIIVGTPKYGDESLYDCLDSSLFHYEKFDDSFIKFALDNGIFDKKEKDEYLDLIEKAKRPVKIADLSSSSIEEKNYYFHVVNDLYEDRKRELLDEKFVYLRDVSYNWLLNDFLMNLGDINMISKFYGAAFNYRVSSFDELLAVLEENARLEQKEEYLVERNFAEVGGGDPDEIGKDIEMTINEVEDSIGQKETPSKKVEASKKKSPYELVSPDKFEGRNAIGELIIDQEELRRYLQSLGDELKLASPEEIPLYFGYHKPKSKNKIEKKTNFEAYFNLLSYVVAGISHPAYLTYEWEEKGYKDNISWIQLENKKTVIDEPDVSKAKVNDDEINFPERRKGRASKVHVKEEEGEEAYPSSEALEFGTKLHRLFELTDLHTKDTGFIHDPNERKIIDKALTCLDEFSVDEDTIIENELPYNDLLLGSNGFIDLLLIKGDRYIIIDYKTKNIDDPAYIEQLHTYRRNVISLYGIKEEQVEMYLLSILDARLKKIE